MRLPQPTTSPAAPSAAWLSAVPELPALQGAEQTAERLLLLLHYGVDWTDGWVGRYRKTYWDRILPDRVVVATYRANTLRSWWALAAAELQSSPRTPEERLELEQLLAADPAPVLRLLREQTDALVLRTRIVAEAVRAGKTTRGAA